LYDEEVAEAVDKMIEGIIIEMAKNVVKALGIRISDESSNERDD